EPSLMAMENYLRDSPEMVVSGTIGLFAVAVITGVGVAGFSGGGGDGAATAISDAAEQGRHRHVGPDGACLSPTPGKDRRHSKVPYRANDGSGHASQPPGMARRQNVKHKPHACGRSN